MIDIMCFFDVLFICCVLILYVVDITLLFVAIIYERFIAIKGSQSIQYQEQQGLILGFEWPCWLVMCNCVYTEFN